jgi:hypothetical protein
MDFLGLYGDVNNYIKFTMVVLCFGYSLLCGKSTSRGLLLSLQAALFFTVVSDLFILILDYYFYGVLTFILVQLCYGIRMDISRNQNRLKREKTPLWKTILLRLGIQAATTIITVAILTISNSKVDLLLIATVFYFTGIIINTIASILLLVQQPRIKDNWIFAIGMCLFLLCDINVGIFNLSGYIDLQGSVVKGMVTASALLMWAFYAPSQMLIALTARRDDRRYRDSLH